MEGRSDKMCHTHSPLVHAMYMYTIHVVRPAVIVDLYSFTVLSSNFRNHMQILRNFHTPVTSSVNITSTKRVQLVYFSPIGDRLLS